MLHPQKIDIHGILELYAKTYTLYTTNDRKIVSSANAINFCHIEKDFNEKMKLIDYYYTQRYKIAESYRQ